MVSRRNESRLASERLRNLKRRPTWSLGDQTSDPQFLRALNTLSPFDPVLGDRLPSIVPRDVGSNAYNHKGNDTRMRLWTLHPKYLDAAGLVALWRESLLAQKVLRGHTTGYKHHPQLIRFQAMPDPLAAIAAFLDRIHEEAVHRNYQFDATKIAAHQFAGRIEETEGQLLYEWCHFNNKLKRRSPERFKEYQSVPIPQPNPVFHIIPGAIRAWERMK